MTNAIVDLLQLGLITFLMVTVYDISKRVSRIETRLDKAKEPKEK